VSLDANALVDLATAKGFLNVPGSSEDPRIERAINAASDLCERWTGRVLRQRTLTNLRLPGPSSSILLLKGIPIDVTQAVTVTVDGTAQTVWRTEADGDPSLKDVLVGALVPESALFAPDHLYRAEGWSSGTWGNPFNVLLTYTGGLKPIPDDLQRACLYIVQKLYRDEQRQLAEVAQVNTPMGGITILDNAIPRLAQALLSAYRLLLVAA
jgi:hypothetical protein